MAPQNREKGRGGRSSRRGKEGTAIEEEESNTEEEEEKKIITLNKILDKTIDL